MVAIGIGAATTGAAGATAGVTTVGAAIVMVMLYMVWNNLLLRKKMFSLVY